MERFRYHLANQDWTITGYYKSLLLFFALGPAYILREILLGSPLDKVKSVTLIADPSEPMFPISGDSEIPEDPDTVH